MHQPADVGGQLLGLRAGEQHRVVERVQKAALREPTAPIHQLGVHQRHLAGRTTEADQTQLQPET